ncbi:SWIM zinc finger family protein [Dawidia soli]|uniref:SWIM zinc finger domain-containing protein n=1 Tax=Dawidia soli TaxID=2782352 RepID=A0AAP2DDK2_9BACT|nr:SWIM zinc finger family protein [Dawidia soli]MBT1688785.1 SWIM zinc finger domain-containing protein [Dawidia soli]
MNFSEEQVLAMAPDDSSKRSGKELANASKWGLMAHSARALWGECQGSGKLPYQTQVDLVAVAFKCTCPSRKFPCKHGLGLMLLYARDKKHFVETPEPAWVTDWLDKRSAREEKKSEKAEKATKADPEAQAKRQATRLRRVEEGMADLKRWIKDIVRNGLHALSDREANYFETTARRMVDAQAPGLAAMVRQLGEINRFQEGWQGVFLEQLIRIYLVIEGFSRLDQLPEDLQTELRTWVGFAQSQEEVKAGPNVRDTWMVLSRRAEQEDNLTVERTWLYGTTTQQYALILQFAVRNASPELTLIPGTYIDAALCYFPGATPRRALVLQQFGVAPPGAINGLKSWHQVADTLAAVQRVNPLVGASPVIIDGVIPVRDGSNRWLLKDAEGHGVVLQGDTDRAWKLMAISGGAPLRLFAVGRAQAFEPLGVWIDEHYVAWA